MGFDDKHPEIWEKLRTALAALGKPTSVEGGSKLELTPPDRTIDALRVAAENNAPLNRRLFDW